ncbi:dUTP diphosphatase [Candidatus Woesearchaeota archaeon]|nr:dUTP diphosphatase [Candidatus Woesearchaeota archaeon]
MNTEDFKSFPWPGDVNIAMDIMFAQQRELLLEYLKVENISVDSFDINTLEDQQILKDFLEIRVVEELTEAYEAYKNIEAQHYKEEIVDAFNFLMEAYIIYGWDYTELSKISIDDPCWVDDEDTIKSSMWSVTYSIGMTCNKLKNRLWKQSQYLVDLLEFEKRFRKVWSEFFDLVQINMSIEELYKEWSKKFQVNKFRLESKY